jgi:hypothetical protein
MLIQADRILLINCSKPNYNLAIDKMKVFYGDRATVVETLFDIFLPDFDAVALSVIFSWDVPFAITQAKAAISMGKQVMIGGGGTMVQRNYIERETGIKPIYRVVPELESVQAKFKMVYFTRGCIETCSFCIVPKIEGQNITLNRDSFPAKVLLDNNLSELPSEYQEFIVEKYLSEGITSVDANSGFEPKGINEYVVNLFNKLPLRWWRIGFDEIGEEKQVLEAIRVIKSISKKMIRVYTMIGHEPIEQCRYRCEKVIQMKCEPVPQAYIKLGALEKTPDVQHDWSLLKLRDFQRFFYQPALWRRLKLEEYAPRVDKVQTFHYLTNPLNNKPI